MDRLEEDFGNEIDFVRVDLDLDGAWSQIEPYGLTGRSQYALVDPDGEVWERWYGPLNEGALSLAFNELLIEME